MKSSPATRRYDGPRYTGAIWRWTRDPDDLATHVPTLAGQTDDLRRCAIILGALYNAPHGRMGQDKGWGIGRLNERTLASQKTLRSLLGVLIDAGLVSRKRFTRDGAHQHPWSYFLTRDGRERVEWARRGESYLLKIPYELCRARELRGVSAILIESYLVFHDPSGNKPPREIADALGVDVEAVKKHRQRYGRVRVQSEPNAQTQDAEALFARAQGAVPILAANPTREGLFEFLEIVRPDWRTSRGLDFYEAKFADAGGLEAYIDATLVRHGHQPAYGPPF